MEQRPTPGENLAYYGSNTGHLPPGPLGYNLQRPAAGSQPSPAVHIGATPAFTQNAWAGNVQLHSDDQAKNHSCQTCQKKFIWSYELDRHNKSKYHIEAMKRAAAAQAATPLRHSEGSVQLLAPNASGSVAQPIFPSPIPQSAAHGSDKSVATAVQELLNVHNRYVYEEQNRLQALSDRLATELEMERAEKKNGCRTRRNSGAANGGDE